MFIFCFPRKLSLTQKWCFVPAVCSKVPTLVHQPGGIPADCLLSVHFKRTSKTHLPLACSQQPLTSLPNMRRGQKPRVWCPAQYSQAGKPAARLHSATYFAWLLIAAATTSSLGTAAAQAAATQCPAGEFGLAGSSGPCVKCNSSQASCLGGSLVLPAPGWWQPSATFTSMSR
jgi:hypothetical protein